MRPSVLRHAVLPAAAAVVLLAGCTGSGDEASTTTPEETSAAETSAPATTSSSPSPTATADAAGSEFCTQATSIRERISGSLAGGDPSALPQVFRDTAQEIRTIEAPEEISQDWTALGDGVERVAATLGDVDVSDPQSLSSLPERLAPLQQELGTALGNVQTYVAEECGVGEPTEGSAPTS